MHRHLIALDLPARAKVLEVDVSQGFPGNIGNATTRLAAEMMVGLHIGVVPAYPFLEQHFPHEVDLTQGLQGAVDRCLGGGRRVLIEVAEDIFGGGMVATP
jgi:hypothetical protein